MQEKLEKVSYLVWTLVSKEKAHHRHTMTVVEALWSVETFLRVSKLTNRTNCIFLNFIFIYFLISYVDLELEDRISKKQALSEFTIFQSTNYAHTT